MSGTRRIPVGKGSVSDWEAYSLVIGATVTPPTKGTVVTDKAFFRTTNTACEIVYHYEQSAPGSDGSGDYLFPLPIGFGVNTELVKEPGFLGSILGPALIKRSTAPFKKPTAPLASYVVYAGGANLKILTGGVAVGSTVFELGTSGSLAYAYHVTIPIF